MVNKVNHVLSSKILGIMATKSDAESEAIAGRVMFDLLAKQYGDRIEKLPSSVKSHIKRFRQHDPNMVLVLRVLNFLSEGDTKAIFSNALVDIKKMAHSIDKSALAQECLLLVKKNTNLRNLVCKLAEKIGSTS